MLKTTFKTLAILIFITIMNSTTSCANEGYNIKVRVDGLSDTLSYLAHHYGERQYLQDTVEVDDQGRFAFSGDEKLPGGMYMIVLPGQKYFEVIIDKDQHFEIETVMDQFVESMEFTNSPQNTSFYEYIGFIRDRNREIGPIREELNDPGITDERREELREKSKLVDQQVEDKQEKHIKKFPDCVFTLLLKAQRSTPPPPTIMKDDGAIDHQESYRQYKKSFWENIDFNDDRILRTPAYHAKLKQYFDNVVIKHPDSVITEADRIISKTIDDDEMFKYTIWFLTNHFERSNIMGMDAVFVHMVDEYYKTGKAFWLNEEQLESITERADNLRPILIGKTAPNIKMYLPDKSTISLHEVEAKYTVIYFWDTECPHCKRKTPKMNDLYNEFKGHGLEIFAVNTEVDREKWLTYIENQNIEEWINVNDATNQSGFRDKYDIYSIPLVFLLDEDKSILAKRINVEQLEDILTRKIAER